MFRHKNLLLSIYKKLEIAESGCHLWTGTKTNHGYGVFRQGYKTKLVHRYIWEKNNGAIPEGMEICHKCDVKLCCNNEHLFLGTHADNMKDAANKGIMQRGELRYNARLNRNQILEIRQDGRSQRKIAKDYGVNQSHIGFIKKGLHWGWV